MGKGRVGTPALGRPVVKLDCRVPPPSFAFFAKQNVDVDRERLGVLTPLPSEHTYAHAIV